MSFAKRGVTAVFAANDYSALGVLKAAHQRGIRVPEDLSVVGFDDVPESGYFLPSLTTMRQDFAELGRQALSLLLAQLDGNPSLTPSPSCRPSSFEIRVHLLRRERRQVDKGILLSLT
jgi:DNA-binding LacI/PurR family transcriptional regulator